MVSVHTGHSTNFHFLLCLEKFVSEGCNGWSRAPSAQETRPSDSHVISGQKGHGSLSRAHVALLKII